MNSLVSGRKPGTSNPQAAGSSPARGANVITDAMRYQWLMANCVETVRDRDGEEMSYFLHFSDTNILESVEDAIDRHIRAGVEKP